jgi:KipI family sensor histidine kinase inhibitor
LQRFLDAVPQLDPVAAAAHSGEVVEIPARYDGPDLADVAAAAGVSAGEVVRRHSAVTYEASFTGFAPGFAYLTGLDPALRMTRRSSPRPRVPAGSVAIADAYSAVYPRASPGGWHLLGSTDVVIFDASRDPAALIAPGTRVRFVPLP